jgi:putative endonuclease
MEKQWLVYILRCGDGTLYTGTTDDLPRRLEMHRAGKGAKYTRGRGPLVVVYREDAESYSDALKREYQIKQLSRAEKLNLIESRQKTAAE